MTTPSETFPRSYRLSGKLNFAAVYENGKRATRGPIVLFARANTFEHARLGLSVPRRVGTAVRRNLIKRRLREAFRTLPAARCVRYDLVLVVRPHEPIAMREYQLLLGALIEKLCRE